MTTGSVALAQSSTEQAREPSTRESALKLSTFVDQLKLGTDTKPAEESWLSGATLNCFGCGFDPGASRPEPTNRNAPRVLEGKWRRDTPLGAVSAGFIGARNYGMPLSTLMPIGGGVERTLLGSDAGFLGPSSQWSLTASFEKTLVTFSGGATVGVAADVLIPVRTESAVAGDLLGGMTSRTIRLGIRFRW